MPYISTKLLKKRIIQKSFDFTKLWGLEVDVWTQNCAYSSEQKSLSKGENHCFGKDVTNLWYKMNKTEQNKQHETVINIQ